jgi:RNA polymerase sigma factor (sigma-70 family)
MVLTICIGSSIVCRTVPMSDFNTTQWTIILQAGEFDPVRKAHALESLCRSYWLPLFTFTKNRVSSHEEAEDLTQGFFQHLLARDFAADLRPENGRFRSWLLAVLKHHLASQHRYNTRQKRGGKELCMVALDDVSGELIDPANPDADYEKEWARSVLANSLDSLKKECAETGHAHRFEVLSAALFDQTKGEGATSEQAAELGVTHNAAKIALTRLRQRYREILRKEVTRLVDDPAEVDDEIAHLIRVLRGL